MKWALLLTSLISSPSSSFSHSLSTSSSSCYPSTSPRLRSNITLCYFAEEMGSTEESFSNTGYEPKDYLVTETYVESLTESMTEQRFPEQRFLEDVDYDDAAIGEMLFSAPREQVYHSQREGLSVGQSSSSVSDRSGQPVVESGKKPLIDRGNQLWKEVKNSTLNTHRLGLFCTDRGSKSSPTVTLWSGETNSRVIMTEEVYKK